VDDRSPPWRFEGTLVEHARHGRGRLFADPDGRWVRFVPAGSGPIIAIPAERVTGEVRVVPTEEMTDDELEDLDWEAASWLPLAEADPALAVELADLVVDAFLQSGGLDRRWRDEALAQLRIDLGHTPKGVRILRFVLPIAAGESLHEWDGDPNGARDTADGVGETAGRTITVERAAGSPCGWEPPSL